MRPRSESRRPMQHRYSTCPILPRLPAWIRARTVKDGSRRFDVIYRRGGRYFKVEHAGTFRTRKEANARRDTVADWLARALDPHVELARATAPGLTIGELGQRWLASRRRISDSTRTEYDRRVARITDDLGHLPVDALTVARVNEWVGEIERAWSAGTVALHLQVLRQVLDFHGGLNVARDRRVEAPRQTRRQIVPPDATETLACLSRLNGRYRQVCVLMEQTGMRVGEALAVREQDLDHAGLRILVRVSKTGRPRWVPCPRWLLECLTPPFPMTRQQVYNALHSASALADVRNINPHALRHRRGSLWHLKGVPAVQAADWLGHSPVMHLRVYAHVMPVDEIPAHDLASLLSHA